MLHQTLPRLREQSLHDEKDAQTRKGNPWAPDLLLKALKGVWPLHTDPCTQHATLRPFGPARKLKRAANWRTPVSPTRALCQSDNVQPALRQGRHQVGTQGRDENGQRTCYILGPIAIASIDKRVTQ